MSDSRPFEDDPTADEAALNGFRRADARRVFAGVTFDAVDHQAGGGRRVITAGTLGDQVVLIAWRRRGPGRRILAMRRADAHETSLYRARLGPA